MLFNKSDRPPVKGSGVRSMVAFARKVGGEEKFQRLLERFSPEERTALSGNILPTDRFEEKTNQALINGIVQVILGGNPERAKEIGIFLINDGLNVVYRALYKVGNPGWILSNAALLWKQYHEDGSLDVLDKSSSSARIRITFDFLDIAFCRVIVGCILRSLELSGGKDIKIVHETCIAHGDPVCTYAVTWTLR